MKIITTALALSMILPAAAIAQGSTTADANSQSGASSQVILEGSSYQRHAPGLGGVSAFTTAPCSIGNGFGIVGPGAGVQWSGGRVDKGCVTRTEAAMLRDLLDMPPSAGRQAAIHHACANSAALRDTLVAMGACVVRGR